MKRNNFYSFVASIACLLVLCFAQTSIAQDTTSVASPTTTDVVDNTTIQPFDSAKLARLRQRFNPQKALLYASILPGAGQVYTKKYWKVPIVYGGFAFFGYYIDVYNDGYRKYRGELFEFLNTGSSPSGLPEASIRTVINRYRRERDFFIILAGAWYALQIIDAHVDAHLKEFDINPNLKVRVEPTMQQDMLLGRQTGFTVSIRF